MAPMPADYSIDVERGLVEIRLGGVVRLEEIWAMRDRLLADPSYESSLDVLVDATTATSFAVSGAMVRSIAGGLSLDRQVRRAFVAGTEESYGIFRMFQTASERPGVRVFRSRGAAERWLATGVEQED
jgi:hypothetical protein